jgi:hypothetical protein
MNNNTFNELEFSGDIDYLQRLNMLFGYANSKALNAEYLNWFRALGIIKREMWQEIEEKEKEEINKLYKKAKQELGSYHLGLKLIKVNRLKPNNLNINRIEENLAELDEKLHVVFSKIRLSKKSNNQNNLGVY